MECEKEYFDTIQRFWRVNDVSWREIMTYHRDQFENDVADSVDYYGNRRKK